MKVGNACFIRCGAQKTCANYRVLLVLAEASARLCYSTCAEATNTLRVCVRARGGLTFAGVIVVKELGERHPAAPDAHHDGVVEEANQAHLLLLSHLWPHKEGVYTYHDWGISMDIRHARMNDMTQTHSSGWSKEI